MHFRHAVATLLLVCNSWAFANPVTDTPADVSVEGVSAAILGQLQEVGRETGSVASQLASTAMGLIGVPYRFGGQSADTGLDCSGLVRTVYQQTLGLVLPRRAAEQARATEKIRRDELRPGDLVFFNTMRRAFSHVGIYLGDGKFIHAPRAGQSVRVEDMNQTYWARRFNGASRVADTQTAANSARLAASLTGPSLPR